MTPSPVLPVEKGIPGENLRYVTRKAAAKPWLAAPQLPAGPAPAVIAATVVATDTIIEHLNQKT